MLAPAQNRAIATALPRITTAPRKTQTLHRISQLDIDAQVARN